MSKLGKKLIKAAKEGVEIAKWNATADLDAWEWRIRNETREECAKVAESTTYMSGAAIAAAIRALKT